MPGNDNKRHFLKPIQPPPTYFTC